MIRSQSDLGGPSCGEHRVSQGQQVIEGGSDTMSWNAGRRVRVKETREVLLMAALRDSQLANALSSMVSEKRAGW